MNVAHSFEDIRLDVPVVLSIGTFDGVHRGHRYLLERARERASELGLALAVVTFDPCPAVVLRPSLGRYQISSASQKLRLLTDVQVSLTAMLPFTLDLAGLTADQFMDALEARLEVHELWFGEDFRFGKNRGGDLPMLVERGRRSGFSLHVVSRSMEDTESISSTRIRKALAAGDVESAMPLLGYAFERECASGITGPWIDELRSAVLCAVSPHLLLPADGVYAVTTSSGESTVAAVSVSDPKFQLRVRDVDAHPAFSVEFVHRLCDIAEYADNSPLWDGRAHDLMATWQRPAYDPVSHH